MICNNGTGQTKHSSLPQVKAKPSVIFEFPYVGFDSPKLAVYRAIPRLLESVIPKCFYRVRQMASDGSVLRRKSRRDRNWTPAFAGVTLDWFVG